MAYKAPRPPFQDVAGQRFGMLEALYLLGSKNNNIYFRFRCDCGREADIMRSAVTSGRQKSCGCLHPQVHHGHARKPEYRIWVGVLHRCYDPNTRGYTNYGGRGITVCECWRKDVSIFISDMGPRPTPKHSIERIDNDGDYEPTNCRWATVEEQVKNKRLPRRGRMITHNGKTQNIRSWARETGIHHAALYARIVTRKWPVEKALTP